MGYVETRTLLAERLSLPADVLTPVCGNIIDLGDFSTAGRALWFDDLWLVINAPTAFGAAAGSPLLAMGVSTFATVPTAADLFGSANRIWQYGNVDPDGVVSVPFGFAAGTSTVGQLLVTRMNRVKGINILRYMGLWLAQACPDATGTFEAGEVTAYLTPVPPNNDFTFPDGV